jgi:mxaK protein
VTAPRPPSLRRRRLFLPRAGTVIGALAAAAALALLWQALHWQLARNAQAVVADAAAAPVPDDAASAAMRRDSDARRLIVQATQLRGQGRHDDAVRILQALAARSDIDDPTALVVRYNLGNELLALALAHNTKGDEDRAMTLVELAKQRYREVLRTAPQHWDARHNLDIALRLAPETEPPAPEARPTNVQRIQVDLRGIRGVDLP